MFSRSLQVLISLVPFFFSLLRDRKRYIFFGSPRRISEEIHKKRAISLKNKITRLGTTFIKLTQILSSRADIIPPHYLEELSKLQDQVEPIDSAKIIEVVEEELGRKIDQIFDSFDNNAIAAASLGQVHKARYRGQDVIVKVLKPGVVDIVEMDLRIMFRILNFFDIIYPSHEVDILMTIVSEFSRIIREEMDFRKEAEHIEIFRENFASNQSIIIPEVHHDLTTRRVLVLTYYDGVKIDDIEGLREMNIDVKKLINELVYLYSHQVLIDGIFHADPHPGNILVNNEGKIILLDFGMVVPIDEETKNNLVAAAVAGARRDYDGLVDALIKLQIIGPETNISVMKDAIAVMTDIFDKKKVSKKRIQEISNEIFATFYQFPLNLPSNLVYLFKSAVMIEGIGMRFDPTFNGIKDGTPVVRDLFKESMKKPREDILETILQKGKDFYKMTENLEQVLKRAERELFRVRLHPVDLIRVEGFMGYMLRRVLVGIGATTNAIVGAIIYVKNGNLLVLALFLAFSAFLFGLTFILPARRLFDTRERHTKRFESELQRTYHINKD